MDKLLINVSVGTHAIQASMQENMNEVFTFVVVNCPLDCDHIVADSCPTCPYQDAAQEKALLDEYEPKLVEALERVAEILGFPIGTSTCITRQTDDP